MHRTVSVIAERRTGAAAGSVALFLLLVAASLLAGPARGTPLYAARAGRTCDNCHLDPGQWNNPQVRDRRCTLSCVSCHVDPAGGGLRNAAGRFYGSSTLPMIAGEPRPTRDWDREVLGIAYRKDRRTTYNDDLPRGPRTRAEQDSFPPDDRFAHGVPAGGRGRYSYTQGRYGSFRADPVIRVGWDVRLGLLNAFGPYEGRALAFPMQFDLGAAVQPMEHATLLLKVGARGRTGGFEDALKDESTPFLREGFLLVHELPWQAYLKAGRFVPSYGLRLDDHTAFIRRRFGLDQSLPESRVSGVEIGANANYPFLNASWFKAKAVDRLPDAFNPFDVDAGWGAAVNAGYRELGWAVGGSWLARRRSLEDGGDRDAFGLYGALNLWFYRRSLPLTWQFEIDRGSWTRGGGTTANDLVFYQELAWLAGNGVNVLAGQSWEDPDRDVQYDEAHRIHLGVQVTPVPGVTVDGRFRYLIPRRDDRFVSPGAPSASAGDFFVQLHLWN